MKYISIIIMYYDKKINYFNKKNNMKQITKT